MEMVVRIIPIASLALSQTVLRVKMQCQRDSLICYLNRGPPLWTKQRQSLNSASIVEVLISRDTGRSRE
jgi:hypothetical protein